LYHIDWFFCRTILTYQGLVSFARAAWFFYFAVGFSFLVFCSRFLDLCSSWVLVSVIVFFCSVFILLSQDKAALVFLPHQCLGGVWEELTLIRYLVGFTRKTTYLFLSFFLLGGFDVDSISLDIGLLRFSVSIWLSHSKLYVSRSLTTPFRSFNLLLHNLVVLYGVFHFSDISCNVSGFILRF
jgi:hypothetical protein